MRKADAIFQRKKQDGKLIFAEGGKNITIIFAINVTGHFEPSLFISPRKKWIKVELMITAPLDNTTTAHESGWMNGNIFLQ
jgi:hypothetical protein